MVLLQFILGRSGSGKSTCILEQMRRTLAETDRQVILLVPEQFSFETERKIYRNFHGRDLRRIEVVSFNRLANSIFRRYGGLAGDYADNTDKTIIMSLALEQIQDGLTLYGKSSNSALTRCMLDAVNDFKTWGITPARLEETAASLEAGNLKDKLTELSLIYAAYDGILGRLYLDPLDDIARAQKILESHSYFTGKAVYVDEFDGFTASEMGIIKELLLQAENVTVSLCMSAHATESDGIFASVVRTYHKLIRLAKEVGVSVKKPITLTEAKRFFADSLCHLEQNILGEQIHSYGEPCEAVKLYTASDAFDEVEYTLATLRKLVREEGYRYRDIVITARDLSPYQELLQNGAIHYDIPIFMDMRTAVTEKALIRFVENLLKAAAESCRINDVMNFLKCGVLDYTVEDISRFENYIYTWDLRGSSLQKTFTAHPRGYVEVFTDADREELDFVNRIRAEVVAAVDRLKSAETHSGSQISATLYWLLEELHVKQNIQTAAEQLLDLDRQLLTEELVETWDVLVEILDSLASALQDRPISLKRYLELYQLVAAGYRIGEIPGQLDAVTVGSSERIRTANPRAVFVLGVNDGVFPYLPSESGLLTDREKQRLCQLSIEFSRDTEQLILQERYLSYKALTGCSERLFLSYRRADVDGKPLAPSFLTEQLIRMFGEGCKVDPATLDDLYYCQTKQMVFSRFAGCFGDDSPLRSTMEQYLNERGYRDRIQKLYRMFYRKGYRLEEKETAVRLFGEKIRLSASRFEDYHKCRFLYFCRSGLHAKPQKKAELNRMEVGTLIHDMLYTVMSDPANNLAQMSDTQLKKEIRKGLDQYIENKMGGVADKSNRFLYLYRRMHKTLFQILSHLREEMQQCEFVPSDFELPIGYGQPVDALEVVAPDGTKLWIEGKIDRVDVYEKDGKRYVRVIDYKSGGKEFTLSDVLYGVNMQMLIYLFAIWNTQSGKYQGSLPAGILYMPAGRVEGELPRDADAEQIAVESRKAYRMNGLLLDNEAVLEAMERDLKGIFIPVKRLATEKKSDSDDSQSEVRFQKNSPIASLAQLGELQRFTEKLLGDMAVELHRGEIGATPLEDKEKVPCEYCDYRAVCGWETADPTRVKEKIDNPQAVYSKMKEALGDA